MNIDYINSRENHFNIHGIQFNNIEENRFDLNSLREWAIQVSDIRLSEGKTFRILELGTKRSDPNISTHHKQFFEGINNCEFIMTDYQEGIDVDVVCDLHKTSSVFENESFDLIISCSTYEHLKYPQLVSHNLMKLLRIGGRIYIQTHQSFPLHGYKYDYFRFSREALKSIFNKNMNFHTVTTYFTEPCYIMGHRDHLIWNHFAESYLNVVYIGQKMDTTPKEYIYDIDGEN